ncbi:MAG: hypothetical protein Q9P01_18330 [Anaerolineae bacterium]|nr:hypothetical protein [Anaerolineae bacterium]
MRSRTRLLLLTPLAILISWEVSDRPSMHLALLLLFEGASMGVFTAMDMLVFFMFYELSLVPMYFLINQWGSLPQKGVKNSGRFSAPPPNSIDLTRLAATPRHVVGDTNNRFHGWYL